PLDGTDRGQHRGAAQRRCGDSRVSERSVPARDPDRHRRVGWVHAGLADQSRHGASRRGLLDARRRHGGAGPTQAVASSDVRRTLAWFVVILTGLLLQSTLFAPPNGFTLAGARPELMYLVTIVLAMLEGPASGAVAGFAGGMAEDLLLNLRGKGSTALTLTLLGYVVGQLRQYIVTPSP